VTIVNLKIASLLAASAFAAQANDELTAISEGMMTQSCPDDFFELPLFPEASLCQIFADQLQLPASLSYHAKSDQQSTKEFYQQLLGEAESEETLKGRILMQYQNGEKIIIISEDGNGSQVDILVKTSSNH
jgi:hypothetical protein